MHLFRAAILAVTLALAFAPDASAQQLPYQERASIDLSQGVTRWSVDESWNNDALIYTFQPNGTFYTNSADGGIIRGRWVQSGARVVMDWPSFQAVYIGRMSGNAISGVGMSDAGHVFGSFVLTRTP